MRKAWWSAFPDYKGALTDCVRDLGICVRGYGRSNHLLPPKIETLKAVATKIGALPVERLFKARMATGLIFGRGLYGVEVDGITQQQVTVLRKLMATAVWQDR